MTLKVKSESLHYQFLTPLSCMTRDQLHVGKCHVIEPTKQTKHLSGQVFGLFGRLYRQLLYYYDTG